MPSIFLSYRRTDAAGYAGRLADHLRERFGPDSVFQDVDNIQAGADFPRAIEQAVGSCQVLLALIGDSWAAERSTEGARRLDDPGDFVRLEVGAALRRGTAVIPVLVEGARMPREEELPPDLKPLTRHQALELSDSRWRYDTDRLAAAIERIAGKRVGSGLPSSAPAQGRRWFLGLLVGGGAALAAGAGFYWLRTRRIDVAGRWQLPSGNSWVVSRDGGAFRIEEFRGDTGDLWARGEGALEDRQFRFRLDLVHSDRFRYRGTLEISGDGRRLAGRLTEVNSGESLPFSVEKLR